MLFSFLASFVIPRRARRAVIARLAPFYAIFKRANIIPAVLGVYTTTLQTKFLALFAAEMFPPRGLITYLN